MAFDKNMALRLAEPVEDAYMACVDRLIVNIARHLGTGKAFRTAAWETAKLAEMGQLSAENAKIINEETKRIPAEIRAALDEVSKAALEGLEKAIADAIARGDLAQAPADSVQTMLQELQQQALDAANLVNTVMLDSGQSAYVQAINNTVMWQEQALDRQAAQAALNDAAAAVTIGSETRRQALQKAITQLADSGIYALSTAPVGTGRRKPIWAWTSARRCTMQLSSPSAAASRTTTARFSRCRPTLGPRPLCYPYQGRYYSWDNTSGSFVDGDGVRHNYAPLSSTSYGQPAGLFGINCGHRPYPQIPGVSIPRDDDIQDKEANDRLYQESQQQRALERSIRDAKRRQAAFKAAGLDDAAKDAGALIAQRQAAMRDFIARTGRVRRYDRESIRGVIRNGMQTHL